MSFYIQLRSSRLASRSEFFPKTLATDSHCLRRLEYSVPSSSCFTFELITSMVTFESSSGKGVASYDLFFYETVECF